MKLVEILNADAITVDINSTDKKDVLSELVNLVAETGAVAKGENGTILKKIIERETLGSTGIGKGIGIPHAKCACVKKMVAAIGISKKGIDFRSLDGEPTYIIILLVAPGDNPGPHLKALAKISRLLDDKFVRDRIKNAKNGKEVVKIFKEEEQKQIS